MSATPPANPYVGPRALRTGEALYGRDREVARLYDLMLAERIVLLYSPSGAGKSSLLQAGLVPRLHAEGFTIRPVVRVGMAPPTDAPAGVNRYVLSTLLSLEEDVPKDRQLDVATLARCTLAEYLARRPEADADEVLLLDQFEELLTVDPTAVAEKRVFFAQLGEALRDTRLWVVLAMREDFIAGLDPYRAAVPRKLSTTFRLDLLGREAALLAVRGPAAAVGVTFEVEAAELTYRDRAYQNGDGFALVLGASSGFGEALDKVATSLAMAPGCVMACGVSTASTPSTLSSAATICSAFA